MNIIITDKLTISDCTPDPSSQKISFLAESWEYIMFFFQLWQMEGAQGMVKLT